MKRSANVADAPTRTDVERARATIGDRLARTPIASSRTIGARLKCELFQRTGSFKPRGALNKIAHLNDAERARGAADQALQGVRESASGAGGRFDKLEQVFEDRVSKSLGRLGVMTRGEVADLSKQVAALTDEVRSMVRSGAGGGKASRAGATKRKAKAGARKAKAKAKPARK